eukprot:TRINITY_DN5171_c2_g3_i1.p1 TRINITY_DN5171_c2_g3~~TRINITY_DN5171_c2_g3_i1.p1  ORF type:complete len:896 (-),score=226.72 TRINITY_DN5171_c2_g3_i1:207-2894(-)
MKSCCLAFLALCGLASGMEVRLAGSGTTNPSKFFWEIMEIFQARSKVELQMSYRAVGSGTGQKEFVGQASNSYKAYADFGSGDIPMSSANYQTLTTTGSRQMVHVPFCLGAIAVFHSIPAAEVGNDGLKLSACNLAKIFSGVITTWDHADLKADNPNLKVPAGTKILVGHRTLGSSSTGGLAGYLTAACPASWNLGAGSKLNWPTATGTFTAVEGSPGMVAHIAAKKYAIGYLDAGHGHQRNYQEAKLKNKGGKWLDSKTALATVDANNNNGVAAAGKAAVDASKIPTTTDSDWSAVNLFNQGPADNVWPIVLVSYIYLNKDISGMSADTAGLLKAFVDFVTGPKGQGMLAGYSFNAIPAAMNKWTTTWASMTKPANPTAFFFEDSTTPYTGQGNLAISAKRNSYSLWKLGEMESQVATLTSKIQNLEKHLSDYGIAALHGSGTTNPGRWFAKAMKLLEHRSRTLMLLTYRAVGSSTGMAEFVGQASNGFKSYNHFGSGDIPMKQTLYKQLPAGEEMLHIPFGHGAIGIFHSVPGATVNMDACLLAEVFKGTVTKWDDPKIIAQNPGLKVPAGQLITVGHRTKGSSSTGGLTGYLNTKCKTVWTTGEQSTVAWTTGGGFTPVEGSPGMQKLIQGTKYAIGYLDAGQGHDLNFAEIGLKNKAGTIQTSKESIKKGGVAAAGDQGVAGNVFPADPSADWSAVNLYDMKGADTWPIVLTSYFYVKKDQTKTPTQTAALLKAFMTMIIENKDKLCEEFGFTSLSQTLKQKALASMGQIVFPSGMTEFTWEMSTDTYNGMGSNVISVKRNAYDDYHRDLLEAKITALDANMNKQIAGLTKKVGSAATPAPAPAAPAGGHKHHKDDDDDDGGPLKIVALAISIVAILISTCAVFMAFKATR